MQDNITKGTIDSQQDSWNELRNELRGLDENYVEADGINLKPSQCYRITGNSLTVIYNTNCPESLREKIKLILSKYAREDENFPPEQEFFFP